MNPAQLDARLSVLDAYIDSLKVQAPGTSLSFVWEVQRVRLFEWQTDAELAIEARGSPDRDTILRHARARGCQVKANDEGFSVRLPVSTP